MSSFNLLLVSFYLQTVTAIVSNDLNKLINSFGLFLKVVLKRVYYIKETHSCECLVKQMGLISRENGCILKFYSLLSCNKYNLIQLNNIQQMNQEKPKILYKFIYSHPKWNKQIKPNLIKIAQKKHNCIQLIKILQYNASISCGTSYPMNLLQEIFGQSLIRIFANISKFILEKEFEKILITFLPQNSCNHYNTKTQLYEQNLQINKQQATLLICLMSTMLISNQQPVFCSQISQSNFGYLFTNDKFKTKAILQYLSKQTQKAQKQTQILQIKRVQCRNSIQQLIQNKGNISMSPITIRENGQSIEDFYGCIKVDFANQYIGGGALWGGNLQQQIMFANHPQMFISMLLCQSMKHNEAITFYGFKKYFTNEGYGYLCKFKQQDTYKYKYKQNIAQEYITAIDAVPFAKNDPFQYQESMINRQIIKAYTGFCSAQVAKVVTGNWGCGAFNGDIQLKFLIQWMAASLASKQIIYCPFNLKNQVEDSKIIEYMGDINIAQFYTILLNLCKQLTQSKENTSVFKKINQIL